ncbi:DciA family protein [Nocardia sp. NPDC006044]|uniref:DciA family protein n=1 Tax=Nocardia sp. NPDC006044 TaxID=3364306 RepID=UPI0036C7D692
MGHKNDHNPIPCLTCRPYLVKTAQVNDCGETQEPLRRHPVEDAWIYAIDTEFADDVILNPREAPIPVSMHETTLVVQTGSLPWASAVRTRSESLIGRINARIGQDAITMITIAAPPVPPAAA